MRGLLFFHLKTFLYFISFIKSSSTEDDFIIEDGGEESELECDFEDDLEECSGDEDVRIHFYFHFDSTRER